MQKTHRRARRCRSIAQLICLVTTLGATSAQTASPTQNELQARLDSKLEGAWLSQAKWATEFDDARRRAAASDKRIFVYFSRCFAEDEQCAAVEDVLATKAFGDWSATVIPYAHFTTGLVDRKDEGLFRDLMFNGYPPAFAMLDADGHVLAKEHLGECSIQGIQSLSATAAALQAMRVQGRAGDAAAVRRTFATDLGFLRYSFARASLEFASLRDGMSEPLRAKAGQLLIDLQYQELRRDLEDRRRAGLASQDYTKELDALCLGFGKAGRWPVVDGMFVVMIVMRVAKEAKDTDLYALAHARSRRLLLGADGLQKAPGTTQPSGKESADAESGAKKRGSGGLREDKVEDAVQAAADLLLKLQENFVAGGELKRSPGEALADWRKREGARLEKIRKSQKSPSEWAHEPEESSPLGHRIACTAIACKALVLARGLANHPERRQAVQRAIVFMLENVRDRALHADTAKNWANAYALDFFLVALRRDVLNQRTATRVRNTVPHLIAAIIEEGWPAGWNYGGSEPCAPFMTGPVLLALFDARDQGFTVEVSVVQSAIQALKNTRRKDGGFVYSGGLRSADAGRIFTPNYATVPGSCARATVAELALLRSGHSSVERLRAAVEAFFEHWDELAKLKGQPGSHVPPHGIAPHYFMFAHAYAALAIEALPESDRPPLRTKMQELLLQTRDDGGGWTASEFPRNKAYSTAMGMLALMAPQTRQIPEWSAK